MTNFKKGDAVYRIAAWDRAGTFYIVPGRVYSCGKKRMVVEADNGKCIGRNFKPNDATIYPRGQFQTREMVEEEALRLAQAWLEANRTYWESKLGNDAYSQPGVAEEVRLLKDAKPKCIWRED